MSSVGRPTTRVPGKSASREGISRNPVQGLPSWTRRAAGVLSRRLFMRILLADDHRIVREGVRTLLERAGFEVVSEAEDGRAAVHLARFHRPDIAVLDLVMPGLGGIECARELLAIDPKMHIVLLTVFPDEHQVVAAMRVGVR